MIGLSHYDASKHGAWGFTKNVALELAQHRIWVNALAPGGITTPGVSGMPQELITAFEAVIPMHRMGDADEIARTALFMVSDLASYMTGSQVVVDGGKLLT
jgi:2-deoxy-D-gluconate 3-dehydrogenase